MKILTLIILSLAFMGNKSAPVAEVPCVENTTAETYYMFAYGWSSCDKLHFFIGPAIAVSCKEFDNYYDFSSGNLPGNMESQYVDYLLSEYKSYTKYPCKFYAGDNTQFSTEETRAKIEEERRELIADYSRKNYVIHKTTYFSYYYDCPDY